MTSLNIITLVIITITPIFRCDGNDLQAIETYNAMINRSTNVEDIKQWEYERSRLVKRCLVR